MNWSITLLRLGQRQRAKKSIMRCRKIIDKYHIPAAQAWCSLVEGQLAIERGNRSRQHKIAQAISIGQVTAWGITGASLDHPHGCSRSQRTSKRGGKGTKCLQDYRSIWQFLEAALGRWYWLTGILPKLGRHKTVRLLRLWIWPVVVAISSFLANENVQKSQALLQQYFDYEMKKLLFLHNLLYMRPNKWTMPNFNPYSTCVNTANGPSYILVLYT